jgi:hypothetical protein
VRFDLGKQFEHASVDHVPQPEERVLDAGAEKRKFAPVVVDELAKTRSICGVHPGYFPFHTLRIRTAVQFAAGAKKNPILGVQSLEFDFLAQSVSNRLIDLFEDTRVKKKSGAEIKAEILRFQAGGTTTHVREAFKDAHLYSCGCKKDSGS